MSPSDTPSVPLVERDEVGVVFDCTADRRRLPEVAFVGDLDEQVRVLHPDSTKEPFVASRSQRFRPSSPSVTLDSAWDGNLAELRPEGIEAVDEREVQEG